MVPALTLIALLGIGPAMGLPPLDGMKDLLRSVPPEPTEPEVPAAQASGEPPRPRRARRSNAEAAQLYAEARRLLALPEYRVRGGQGRVAAALGILPSQLNRVLNHG